MDLNVGLILLLDKLVCVGVGQGTGRVPCFI